MAITATTALAPAVTTGVSDSIVVAAGATATIGIYTDTVDGRLPESVRFIVYQASPGQPNKVGGLKQGARTVCVAGPGSFTVTRPAYDGTPFGVFADKG